MLEEHGYFTASGVKLDHSSRRRINFKALVDKTARRPKLTLLKLEEYIETLKEEKNIENNKNNRMERQQ